MADNEKVLSSEQMEMLENLRRGDRVVAGTILLEDSIQASFSDISLGNLPGFRLAFDGKNSEIVKKSGRVRPSVG